MQTSLIFVCLSCCLAGRWGRAYLPLVVGHRDPQRTERAARTRDLALRATNANTCTAHAARTRGSATTRNAHYVNDTDNPHK